MDKKLLRNNDHLLKDGNSDLLSGNPTEIGQGLGNSKHYLMRNNKLLFNGGHPLAFSDTVSPVLNENSWATIKNVLRDGRFLDFWQLGDYKEYYSHYKNEAGQLIETPYENPRKGKLVFAGLINQGSNAVFCSNLKRNAAIDYNWTELDDVDGNSCRKFQYKGTIWYDANWSCYAGSRFCGNVVGDQSLNVVRPSLTRRYLNAEWSDILSLSRQNGDIIPAINRTVTVHSQTVTNQVYPSWGVPPEMFESNFSPEQLYLKNLIYDVDGYLHIPSAYELSGDSTYSETSVIRADWLTEGSIYSSHPYIPKVTEEQIPIFKEQSSFWWAALEFGSAGPASRTPHPVYGGYASLGHGNEIVHYSVIDYPPPLVQMYTLVI